MPILSSIEEKAPSRSIALLDLGFRPFFLLAAVFSLVSILLWGAAYLGGFYSPPDTIHPFYWHAHEMIFGYSLAVIAGFLLTAVKNWTGVQTLQGIPLLGLCCLWALARFSFAINNDYLWLAVTADMAFNVLLIAAVAWPIIKAGQWRQLAVLSKLLLLGVFNGVFYLGINGYLEAGAYIGIYGGFYLVISLILTIGRRVIPFFIERGVGYDVRVSNYAWLDRSSMVLLLCFLINELFIQYASAAAVLALGIAGVNGARLVLWHTPGIWRKALLWSLYLSQWMIVAGFVAMALHYWEMGIPRSLALHAMAFGGIGLVTLSMMARVSLGHTARDIHKPSPLVVMALGLLVVGFIFRVVLPLFDQGAYSSWIAAAVICWSLAFVLFLWVYIPILIKPRRDGQPG